MKKYTEQLMEYLKQYEIIVISCVVIAAVIFLSLSYLTPNFEKVAMISSQYKDLQAKVSTLRAKDEALTAIDQKFYKDNFPKIGLVLPDNKDYVSLFNTFDSLEKKTGVGITRTNLQLGVVSTGSAKLAKTTTSQSQDIPISLTVVGDIAAIKKFLGELRSLTGRLITLEKLDWNYKGGQTIEMVVYGKAFYSSYPSTLGSVSSPLPKINPKQEEIINKISKNTIVVDDLAQDRSINVGKKNLFR